MKNHPFQPLYGKGGVDAQKQKRPPLQKKLESKTESVKKNTPKPTIRVPEQQPKPARILSDATLGNIGVLDKKKTLLLIVIIILVLLIIAVFAYRQQQQQKALMRLNRKLRRLM